MLILHDYGTESGGAERMSFALRDGLRARGHEARLLASTARPLPLENRADYVCFGTMSPARRLLQVANPSAARAVRFALADFRPDVVHVRMFLTQLSPLILGPLHGVPTVLHAVNYNLVCPINTKVWPDGTRCAVRQGAVCRRTGCLPAIGVARLAVQRALWRRGLDAVDAVVANSGWVAVRLREEGIETDEVIWNGVAPRSARAARDPVPTVAFAGRLEAKKGADVLLRATAAAVLEIPGVRLVLAGDGPERPRLEALAASLGLGSRARFLGHLDRDALERALEGAWAQAVPSVWDEPFGLVAAEAMMRGTPVVASDAGGLAEYVEDGRSGLLVPPGDVGALAAALVRLLRDQALGDRLTAAAREYALAELTEERTLDRFERLYERLLAHPGRALRR